MEMSKIPQTTESEEMAGTNSVDESTTAGAHKRQKKVIYFADGTTMEDDDDDDETTDTNNHHPSANSPSAEKASLESASGPATNTSKMQWVRHQTSRAGTKTLSVLEGMGGTAAYYLGITSPKYQSEIDEFNRIEAKKKSHEEELVSWSTGPKSQSGQPVVEDVKIIEKNSHLVEEK